MRREMRVLSLVLLFIPASTLAYDWSNNPGDGSPEQPYEISTPEHLMSIGSDPNLLDKCYILTNDIVFDPNNNPEHVFDKALIAPDTGETSSDYQGTPFSGSFDGNWHTIHGLKIAGGSFLALFGKIQAVTPESTIIKNLFLTNSYVSASFYAGSLVGCLDGGIVRNCFVYNGAVTARYRGGGLIGLNESGSLENACFTGTVDLPDLLQGHDIGGLVGRNDGIINQCFAIADLSVLFDAGGLVGYNEGVISNCYSSGILSGFRYVGGLVGCFPAGEVNRCFSTGSVTGDLAGGLIGYIWGDVTVTDSFWDIETSGTTDGVGNIDPDPSGVTGKTTEEMMTLSTYTSGSWDFINIWDICEGTNYPRFVWQIAAADFTCPNGIDLNDFSVLSRDWQRGGLEPYEKPDLTGDGVIDIDDAIIFVEHWLGG